MKETCLPSTEEVEPLNPGRNYQVGTDRSRWIFNTRGEHGASGFDFSPKAWLRMVNLLRGGCYGACMQNIHRDLAIKISQSWDSSLAFSFLSSRRGDALRTWFYPRKKDISSRLMNHRRVFLTTCLVDPLLGREQILSGNTSLLAVLNLIFWQECSNQLSRTKTPPRHSTILILNHQLFDAVTWFLRFQNQDPQGISTSHLVQVLLQHTIYLLISVFIALSWEHFTLQLQMDVISLGSLAFLGCWWVCTVRISLAAETHTCSKWASLSGNLCREFQTNCFCVKARQLLHARRMKNFALKMVTHPKKISKFLLESVGNRRRLWVENLKGLNHLV